jgi:hypothetical protein
MIKDKDGRELATYTYAERRRLAATFTNGVISGAFATRDKITDVSLVKLAKFPDSDIGAVESRMELECQVDLGQARLGFPHPNLLARIPKGTTGQNVDLEKARVLARLTLISTLSHQERTTGRHKSESLPDERRTYLNGEDRSFDTQEYAKSP